jgi:hypothetical protein
MHANTSKPRPPIADMIAELRSWLPNYDHGPNDYPTTVFRLLASVPGGEELEDMGFEPLGGIGWHELDQLGRMIAAIQDKQDVEELVRGLMSEEEEEAPSLPTLVTGALGPKASLQHTGEYKGIKFEVYHDPVPPKERPHQGEKGYFAAVVYSPYESENGATGVEAEQVGYGGTETKAIIVAKSYIDRLTQTDAQRSKRIARRKTALRTSKRRR